MTTYSRLPSPRDIVDNEGTGRLTGVTSDGSGNVLRDIRPLSMSPLYESRVNSAALSHVGVSVFPSPLPLGFDQSAGRVKSIDYFTGRPCFQPCAFGYFVTVELFLPGPLETPVVKGFIKDAAIAEAKKAMEDLPPLCRRPCKCRFFSEEVEIESMSSKIGPGLWYDAVMRMWFKIRGIIVTAECSVSFEGTCEPTS